MMSWSRDVLPCLPARSRAPLCLPHGLELGLEPHQHTSTQTYIQTPRASQCLPHPVPRVSRTFDGTYIKTQWSGHERSQVSSALSLTEELVVRFLASNQLDALFPVFMYFISLHVWSITVPSSGDWIVLIQHLVWLVCVSDCLVCLIGIPSSHLHRLIIPDGVLIQFDLLMMSTVVLETCRETK